MTSEDIRSILKEEITPLREDIKSLDAKHDVTVEVLTEHRVALFGVDNTNGINGTVKQHTAEIERLNQFKWKAVGIASVVPIIAILIQLWKSFH